MATAIEIINFANKIIPTEYDGTPEKTQLFIDALTLLNDNVGNYMGTAVNFIKTRLNGKARDIITTEATIEAIINKIKAEIKINRKFRIGICKTAQFTAKFERYNEIRVRNRSTSNTAKKSIHWRRSTTSIS